MENALRIYIVRLLTKEEPVTRLLKRTYPMMRGDDVKVLQEQLNKLC